jgi:hypothetical protein
MLESSLDPDGRRGAHLHELGTPISRTGNTVLAWYTLCVCHEPCQLDQVRACRNGREEGGKGPLDAALAAGQSVEHAQTTRTPEGRMMVQIRQ